MPDIGISVALALIAALMGYLGIRLTLHPQQHPRTARMYEIVFGVLAALSVALIVWQGVRNNKAQDQFQGDIRNAKTQIDRVETQVTHATQIILRLLALTARNTGDLRKINKRCDVNGDGVVDEADAREVERQILSGKPEQTMDINADGHVDVGDVLAAVNGKIFGVCPF